MKLIQYYLFGEITILVFLWRVYLSFYLILVFLRKIPPWEDRGKKGRRLEVGEKTLGNNNC